MNNLTKQLKKLNNSKIRRTNTTLTASFFYASELDHMYVFGLGSYVVIWLAKTSEVLKNDA